MTSNKGPNNSREYTPTPADVVRFLPHVRVGGDDECWPWTGTKFADPRFSPDRQYGQFRLKIGGRRTSMTAHRIAYAMAHGVVPRRRCVMHTCDNPPCCNPKHLRIGTHLDNMRDKEAKGRGRQYPACEHGARRSRCRECRRIYMLRWYDTAKSRRVTAAMRANAMAFPASGPELSSAVGDRAASVLTDRFGLYGRPIKTYSDIARSLNVSSQRVNQIAQRALRLLGCVPVLIRPGGAAA